MNHSGGTDATTGSRTGEARVSKYHRGSGLACPADNGSCQRIIRFIHQGNNYFIGSQDERIKFLQELNSVWTSKRISIWLNKSAGTKRTGTVQAVVPLTNSELDLKHKGRGYHPVQLFKLQLQWEDTRHLDFIRVPSVNGNGQPKSP